MKVYVLHNIRIKFVDYEEVVGVFKTKEAAEKYIYNNEMNVTFDEDYKHYIVNGDYDIFYIIKEYELQG